METQLVAKLNENVVSKSSGDSKYNFSSQPTAKATSHFSVNAPVIIAYMPRKQSAAGGLAPTTNELTVEQINDYWDKYSS